jgi:hypothetical protein
VIFVSRFSLMANPADEAYYFHKRFLIHGAHMTKYGRDRVKQVEAVCRALPPDTPEFGHFLPADWLLRHPEFLDEDTPGIQRSLEKFEAAFTALNQFID